MTQEFIIWLAGFFDGEGCLYARDRGTQKGVEFCMILTQNSTEPLDEILSAIGSGRIKKKGGARPKNWKDTHDLFIYNTDVIVDTLSKIQPHLRVKGKQCAVFLKMIHDWKKHGIRPSKDWKSTP